MKSNVDKIENKIFKKKVKREYNENTARRKDFSKAIQKNYLENGSDAKWWKLDNAALLFPAIASKKIPYVFRIAATLKQDVDKEALQRASDKLFERFPALNIGLRKGLFWSYFEELPFLPQVKEERNYPNQQFKLTKKHHLVRVMYYNKKIIMEFFHSVADGTGASKILTYLLISYFNELGIKSTTDFDLNDFQSDEEFEDSFSKYADFNSFEKRDKEKAYQVKGTPLALDKGYVYTAFINLNEIKSVAKEYNVSLTEFILANLMLSINTQRLIYNDKRPVKIALPIDLRRRFDSKTLRNFVCFKNIKMNKTDFKELLVDINEQLNSITKESCLESINSNVKAQKIFFVRVVQLALKNLILKLNYNLFGEATSCTTFSNIGYVKLPEEITDKVESLEIVNGRTKTSSFWVGAVSVNNVLTIGISNKLEEQDVIREFIKRIASFGIKIGLATNKRV